MHENMETLADVAVHEDERAQESGIPETPLAPFRARLIDFATMRPSLRRLTVLGLGLLVVTALVLAAASIPQTQVMFLSGEQLPIVVAIGLAPLTALGFTFLIAGALRAQWAIRWIVVASVVAILVVSNIDAHGGLFPEQRASILVLALFGAQLVLLGLLVLATLAVSIRRVVAHRTKALLETAPPHTGRSFLVILAGFALYYVLSYLWSAAAIGDLSFSGNYIPFFEALAFQFSFLGFLLIAVWLWLAPSYVEVGESVGLALIGTLRRVRASWLVVPLTLILALLAFVDALSAGGAEPVSLLTVLGLIAVAALLTWAAGIRRTWPSRMPSWAVLVGVLEIFSTFALSGTFTLLFDISNPAKYWLNLLTLGVDLVLGVIVGLFLLVRGRVTGQAGMLAGGLFLLYLWLLLGPRNLATTLQSVGVDVPARPSIKFVSVILVGAVLVALLAMLALFTRGHARRLNNSLVVAALLTLSGFEAIRWTLKLTGTIDQLASRTTVAIGLFFLATALWDVMTSGEELTNGTSAAFPRDARVLLYVGYAVVAALLLLATSTVYGQQFSQIFSSVAAIENLAVTGGATYLGIPLVAVGAVMRLGSWRSRVSAAERPASSPSEEAIPTPVPSVGTLPRRRAWSAYAPQGAVVVLGIVALVGLTGTLVTRGRPPSSALSVPSSAPTSHTAQGIGPSCDSGTAHWTVEAPPTVFTCTPQGTILHLGSLTPLPDGNHVLTIGFQTDARALARNYRLSMQVDFAGHADTCVLITTRVSLAPSLTGNGYTNSVCGTGSWVIARDDSNGGSLSESPLAQGQLPQAPSTTTITVTTRNSTQALALNGTPVASVTDGTYTGSDVVYLSFVSSAATDLLVSNFRYTPLGN